MLHAKKKALQAVHEKVVKEKERLSHEIMQTAAYDFLLCKKSPYSRVFVQELAFES